MSAGFWFLLGLVAGVSVAWVLAGRSRRELQQQWEAQLERALPRVAEAVLAPKTKQLEHAAAQELKLLGSETVSQVTQSQAGLEKTLQEMRLQLEQYQQRINRFEQERAAAQERLLQQAQNLAGAGVAMLQEAQTLRTALSTSGGVRGAWGEHVLQNLLNACGLNQGVDYELQETVGEGGRLRPDVIVRLPPDGQLAVDAKANLADFLRGIETSDGAARGACFAAFAQTLRVQARELGKKEYQRHVPNSLPFVVMFVPSEGAFRAALDADPELFQALQPTVMLASPSTLFPLLSVIAQVWREHRATEQMQSLLGEVAELGNRVQTFLEHIQGVGKALHAAGQAYNKALASYRARLVPRLERLQELHAGWSPAPELPPVEATPQLAEGGSKSAGASE